ncbi:hypothetical protein A2U01_0064250, partial [Trifolium medium]|nr:hypothetical protein [Trifolium medium]
ASTDSDLRFDPDPEDVPDYYSDDLEEDSEEEAEEMAVAGYDAKEINDDA